MKRIFIIIILLTILFSCKRNGGCSEIFIKATNDTINVYEDFRAELFIEHLDSMLPEFCIVQNQDTFYLPFDEDKDCAVFFKSGGRKKGDMCYDGFVEFTRPDGKKGKEDFSIKFYVE